MWIHAFDAFDAIVCVLHVLSIAGTNFPSCCNLCQFLYSVVMVPANLFTISELQNPSLDIPELHKIRRSPDLEALKLWKCSSFYWQHCHRANNRVAFEANLLLVEKGKKPLEAFVYLIYSISSSNSRQLSNKIIGKFNSDLFFLHTYAVLQMRNWTYSVYL